MRTLVLILLLLSTQSFAEDSCTHISISTKNMPKNNNQNEHNWCVFWTGADLFSYYEKTRLSSYDLAVQYFSNDLVKEKDIQDYSDIGANMTAALIIAQKGKGLCLESQTNFTNGNWAQLSVLFKKISTPDKKLSQIICQNNLEDARPFKEIPPDLLKILDQLNGNERTAELLDVICETRHRLAKYGVGSRTIEKFSSEQIIDKLDGLISSNNPASISYDWDFIKNDSNYTKKESNHSSTIIGRRFNNKTKQCEYKIKDSAGNRCPKNSIYECDKKHGTIWVPKINLMNNVYEVNWLVKAKN